MEFVRLPFDLQNAVFDHLEPDDLISLHRTTRRLRRCINRRGLLPGRVANVEIDGLVAPGRGPDRMPVVCVYILVESREGVRISAAYPNKRLYHTLDKNIAPGTIEPGYPKSFENWPMRRYRMKRAAYLVKFVRLLERMNATPLFQCNWFEDMYDVQPPYGTPFHVAHRMAIGLGGLRETDAWKSSARPIQLAQLFRAFRWVGRFQCCGLDAVFFSRTSKMLGGRPEVFHTEGGTDIVEIGLPRLSKEMTPRKFFRDFCEPWPTRAHIWENIYFSGLMHAVQELLPRSPSLTPGCLYTRFAPFRGFPKHPVQFILGWLKWMGLIPIRSDCPSAIYFRDTYAKYVAKEFGLEFRTWFFQWPNPEKEVLLLFRMHEGNRLRYEKHEMHATITVMASPNWP